MIVLLRSLCPNWFIIALAVVGLHQFVQKICGISIPLIDSYLDALLFMPIALHLLLWEQRLLFSKGHHYTFSKPKLFLYWLVMSIIAEYLFPIWHHGFTADIIDVLCYALGTLAFNLIGNKPAKAYTK